MSRAAALAAASLLLASAAPPPPQALDAARQAQADSVAAARQASDQAEAAAAEADRLAAARVEAARILRQTEDGMAALGERMATLQAQRDAADAGARQAAAALAPLLPLAVRLGAYPAETLLSVPVPPEQAVRGVVVLQALARQVRDLFATLSAARTQAATAAAALEQAQAANAELAGRQRGMAADLDARLGAAKESRDRTRDSAADAARRAAQDAARAESLRAAVASLEASRRAAEARRLAAAVAQQAAAAVPAQLPPSPPPPSSGRWAVPVAGRLARGFGSATDAGPASGATFQTPPAARVVAPCGGRVAFAGPFRSYGQLVIVACGGGLHVVLAGLGRLDASAGQAVRVGEPVGVMAAMPGAALYVEIRRDGVAIDPSQYLRQNG